MANKEVDGLAAAGRRSARTSRGFFSPQSAVWRVDREMALLLGGGRALLMQLAHPKIAAAVADHSSFREDPLGRLYRTMNRMWSIVFDEIDQARTSLEQVKEVHRKVYGTMKPGDILPPGSPYSALEPDLLFWVHATLVDSAPLTYDLFVRPLSLRERAEYYDETKRLARLFEVPEERIPISLEAFEAYMNAKLSGGEIAVGATALALAPEILRPRPLLLRTGSPLFSLITAGLLPGSLREAYGLPWDNKRERRLMLLAALVRRLLPWVPATLRVVPQARAAERKNLG